MALTCTASGIALGALRARTAGDQALLSRWIAALLARRRVTIGRLWVVLVYLLVAALVLRAIL